MISAEGDMKQLSSEGNSRILYVRLTPAQYKQLEATEQRTGKTRSIIVRTLLDQHLSTLPALTKPGTSEQMERQLAI